MADTIGTNIVSLRSAWAPDQPAARLRDYDAEMALLGALLTKPEMMTLLPASFSSEHYAASNHALIHDTIEAYVASGVPAFEILSAIGSIDPELRTQAGDLIGHMVGLDAGYLCGLANLLTMLNRRRQLVYVAEELMRNASDIRNCEIAMAVSSAINQLDGVSAAAPTGRPATMLADAVAAALDAHDRAARGEACGISTGFASLDAVLDLMEGGQLLVLGGRPGSGKTALALKIGLNAAQAGHGVLMVSLEMQAAALGRRAAADLSGVPARRIKKGMCSQGEIDAIVRATRTLHQMQFSIEDQGGLNIAQITLKARAAKRRHGLGLIIVDHLHIVGEHGDASRMGPTWAIGQISGAFKKLAKDLDVPVLLLAQLSRNPENREDKRPTLADLRQSGAIEQDADAVMLIYRPELALGSKPPERKLGEMDTKHAQAVADWEGMRAALSGRAEVIFPKVRDGEVQTVDLHFDAARTAFREMRP